MSQKYSLRSLQVFEAVSRLGSLNAAAQELELTPSAISHHLKNLSLNFEADLFVRKGRGIEISETGKALGASLTSGFARLDHSVDIFSNRGKDNISIGMCSSFALGYFVPRLESLRSSLPHVQIYLDMYTSDEMVVAASSDLIISPRTLPEPYIGEPIESGDYILVAPSADWFSKGGIIACTKGTGKSSAKWMKSFEQLGLDDSKVSEIGTIDVSHLVLAAEAVRVGVAAAIVPKFLVARDIEKATIVRVGAGLQFSEPPYRIYTTNTKQRDPAVYQVLSWLRRSYWQDVARERHSTLEANNKAGSSHTTLLSKPRMDAR